MSKKESSKRGGVGFVGLLTILFIALKLTGNIHWNWFWVLSPTLIPIILVLLIFMGIGIAAYVVSKK